MAGMWIHLIKYGLLLTTGITLIYYLSTGNKELMDIIPGEIFHICTHDRYYQKIHNVILNILETSLHILWWYYVLS